MYQTWITGTPFARQAAASVLHVRDHVLLLRVLGRAGVGERPAVDDHVVLQVLDDSAQRAGFSFSFVIRLLLSACTARAAGRRWS